MEPQTDIIEVPLEDTLLYERATDIPGCKIINQNIKVTYADLSDDPIYVQTVEITDGIIAEDISNGKIKDSDYSENFRNAQVLYNYALLKFVNNNGKESVNLFNISEDPLYVFILFEDTAYKVEIEEKYTYPAVKSEKDGKTIYSAPYGGILKEETVENNVVIPLNEEWTLFYLKSYGYIKNDNLNLKNTL